MERIIEPIMLDSTGKEIVAAHKEFNETLKGLSSLKYAAQAQEAAEQAVQAQKMADTAAITAGNAATSAVSDKNKTKEYLDSAAAIVTPDGLAKQVLDTKESITNLQNMVSYNMGMALYPSKTENSNITYATGIFSGWQFEAKLHQDFLAKGIYFYITNKSADNPITQIRFVVKQNNVVVLDKTVETTITGTEPQEVYVSFDTPIRVHNTDTVYWGYWCNKLCKSANLSKTIGAWGYTEAHRYYSTNGNMQKSTETNPAIDSTAYMPKVCWDCSELYGNRIDKNAEDINNNTIITTRTSLPDITKTGTTYSGSTFSGWKIPYTVTKAVTLGGLNVYLKARETAISTIRFLISHNGNLIYKKEIKQTITPKTVVKFFIELASEINAVKDDEIIVAYCCDQFCDAVTIADSGDFWARQQNKIGYATNGTMYDSPDKFIRGGDYVPAIQVVQNEHKSVIEALQEANNNIKELQEATKLTHKQYIYLPKEYVILVGDTLEIFYKGILNLGNYLKYNIKITCTKGAYYTKRYIFKPTANDLGTYPLTVTLFDDDDNVIESASTTIRVEQPMSNPSTGKNVLCIGDSLTAPGTWVKQFGDRLAADKLTNIKLVGTQKIEQYGYEGYGGWTYASYLSAYKTNRNMWITCNHDKTIDDQHSQYTDANGTTWKLETIEDNKIKLILVDGTAALPAAGTLKWKQYGKNHSDITYTASEMATGNPFWSETKNANDFKVYSQKLGITQIDYCLILLGWNQSLQSLDTIKQQILSFVSSIRKDYPNVKIIFGGLQVPSLDGFGSSYGCAWNFKEKLNYVFALEKLYEELLTDYTITNAIFTQISGQFDTENNMPQGSRNVNQHNTNKEAYGTNGVHPAQQGYLQIGDAFYRAFNG